MHSVNAVGWGNESWSRVADISWSFSRQAHSSSLISLAVVVVADSAMNLWQSLCASMIAQRFEVIRHRLPWAGVRTGLC